MTITFANGEFDRFTCTMERDAVQAVATAANRQDAIADMLVALDSVTANGHGECFWHEGAGEYRWVFRTDGNRVRLAVLWSAGVMTGWEHVFWAETDEPIIDQMRASLGDAVGGTC